MFKKTFSAAVAAVLTAAIGGAALAQLSGDEAVTNRRADMTAAAKAVGGIRTVANLGSIDESMKAPLNDAANTLVTSFTALSQDDLWPAGSTNDVIANSKAKAEIWSDHDTFKADMSSALTAAMAVQSAVQAGDVDQMKTAVGTMMQTCGGCHKTFRT